MRKYSIALDVRDNPNHFMFQILTDGNAYDGNRIIAFGWPDDARDRYQNGLRRIRKMTSIPYDYFRALKGRMAPGSAFEYTLDTTENLT